MENSITCEIYGACNIHFICIVLSLIFVICIKVAGTLLIVNEKKQVSPDTLFLGTCSKNSVLMVLRPFLKSAMLAEFHILKYTAVLPVRVKPQPFATYLVGLKLFTLHLPSTVNHNANCPSRANHPKYDNDRLTTCHDFHALPHHANATPCSVT